MSNSRKGFIFHFSHLDNIEMMLEDGEAESALDAIAKAIRFDMYGEIPQKDHFLTIMGRSIFNSLKKQIELDKADYLEKVRIRQENGSRGGKPKEFNKSEVQELVNELHVLHGLNQEHFKPVRLDSGGIAIMSFVDKNTERFYLEKSNIFNNNGTRKKRTKTNQ